MTLPFPKYNISIQIDTIKSVEAVAEKLKLESPIEYSTDIKKIFEIGTMSSPVLVIDNKIIFSEKVPTPQEIEDKIKKKL